MTENDIIEAVIRNINNCVCSKVTYTELSAGISENKYVMNTAIRYLVKRGVLKRVSKSEYRILKVNI